MHYITWTFTFHLDISLLLLLYFVFSSRSASSMCILNCSTTWICLWRKRHIAVRLDTQICILHTYMHKSYITFMVVFSLRDVDMSNRSFTIVLQLVHFGVTVGTAPKKMRNKFLTNSKWSQPKKKEKRQTNRKQLVHISRLSGHGNWWANIAMSHSNNNRNDSMIFVWNV